MMFLVGIPSGTSKFIFQPSGGILSVRKLAWVFICSPTSLVAWPPYTRFCLVIIRFWFLAISSLLKDFHVHVPCLLRHLPVYLFVVGAPPTSLVEWPPLTLFLLIILILWRRDSWLLVMCACHSFQLGYLSPLPQPSSYS